jgi:hypothetical protein
VTLSYRSDFSPGIGCGLKDALNYEWAEVVGLLEGRQRSLRYSSDFRSRKGGDLLYLSIGTLAAAYITGCGLAFVSGRITFTRQPTHTSMAEVLTPTVDGQFYDSRTSSPASSSLFLDRHTYTPPPPTASNHAQHTERVPSQHPSVPFSSRASTTDLSSLRSQEPTPASSKVSLEHKYGQQADHEDDYPQFDSYSLLSASESSDEHTESTTTDTTASDSPLPTPSVSDDTAIKTEPSQHVDYLSHDWREEDVWSSWRHIVSQRKVYGQQSRLENAAWRTWVKSKFDLPTVSPETLNW